MKTKTIEKILKSKLEDWLDSIKDENLRKELRAGLLVSGGSIATMFLNEKVNDYDIYLDKMELVKKVANYYNNLLIEKVEVLDGKMKNFYIKEYLGSINSLSTSIDDINNHRCVSLRTLKENQIKLYIDSGGLSITKDMLVDKSQEKYIPVYLSPNAISLSDDIQIVLRFYGTPEEIHKTFDYAHATNYFTFEKGLVTNIKALECLLTKTLIYRGSLYPLTSIIRSKKFIKRGYTISAGEYLKIMFQISKLDLTNMDILEEQLIGVDVAYFSQLINILRDHMDRQPDFELTPNYLNEIINRVFDGSDE